MGALTIFFFFFFSSYIGREHIIECNCYVWHYSLSWSSRHYKTSIHFELYISLCICEEEKEFSLSFFQSLTRNFVASTYVLWRLIWVSFFPSGIFFMFKTYVNGERPMPIFWSCFSNILFCLLFVFFWEERDIKGEKKYTKGEQKHTFTPCF